MPSVIERSATYGRTAISPLDLRRAIGQFTTGAPVDTVTDGVGHLPVAGGVPAAFACRFAADHLAGDRFLFLCEMEHLECFTNHEPLLLFFGSRYRIPDVYCDEVAA